MEYLFAYGTLQKNSVQIESFGRILSGVKEKLSGYKVSLIEIRDETVLAISEEKYHPIAIKSENADDMIEGTLFELSDKELELADNYEVDAYQRIKVALKSGIEAWIYIQRRTQ